MNRLLSRTDILVTDYSSLFSDYLIYNKPIVFAKINHQSYLKEKELSLDYDKDLSGNVKTGRFMSTLKGRNEHDLNNINSTSKLDRVANPSDISPVVEFLLSEASDFISGELIRVDGGLFPQPM